MRQGVVVRGLTAGLLLAGIWAPGGKTEKEMLQVLQTEVTLLQRQIRDLQESGDKNNGQITSLLNQVSDNTAASARELHSLQQSVQRSQGEVTSTIAAMNSQLAQLNERLNVGDTRVTRLSSQLEEIRQMIEQARKSPFGELGVSNVTSPDQLFSAAYSDYARGNYDLCISEFKLYLEMYGNTEAADNAQYWIGEALYSQKKYQEAADALELVVTKYPRGDKAAAARLKRGRCLLQLGRNDEAIKTFQYIVRTYPTQPEAQLAKQDLERLGVAADESPPRRRN